MNINSERWMVGGKKTLFHWVPVPNLTMGRGAGLVSGSNYSEKKGNNRTKWSRDSLFLSFTLSFSSVMAAGAMMAEAAEERDDAAVVAAVVAGHGSGWLAGPATFFLAAQVSILLHLVCMICKFVLAPHRSRFSYTSYDVSFCIITIDRTEEQEETRRIRRKRHTYLYWPFCMPSAILNTRSIFFFKYVHSSASSKKAIKQEKKRREKRQQTRTRWLLSACICRFDCIFVMFQEGYD